MIFIHNVSGLKNCITFWVFGVLGFGAFWFLVSPQFALFWILPSWIIAGIPYSICMGRTIVLSAKGCTIYFLGYHKSYLWEQLKCKRVEDCYNYRSREIVRYKKMVTLSTRHLKKRRVLQPTAFTLLFRPFSGVYFYFKSDIKEQDKSFYRDLRMYEVDETLFWEKMKEWGVELEIE